LQAVESTSAGTKSTSSSTKSTSSSTKSSLARRIELFGVVESSYYETTKSTFRRRIVLVVA
jgi:hypothetical protein